MSGFYEDTPALLVRFGMSADRPTDPPDKSCLFWDMQTGKLWAVNDSMVWVNINPTPVYTGESHIRIAAVATSIYPSALMWAVPSLGAFIYEARLVIDSGYDVGITLSVGDSGDNNRLIPSGAINAQTPGTYKTNPLHQYAAGAGINIYCSASPTTGSGTLYLMYDENPA